ncbi:MAG: ABC transporter substrate-binding protein [Acidobacteriota bacterium]
MRKRRKIVALLASLLIPGTVGCGAGVTEVRIGAILSMEGRAASYGESIWRGVQVAMDEVNAAGGVTIADSSGPKPLIIELRDDKSDPHLAGEEARELIEMGVPAVIGSDSSGVTLAIAPLFQEAGVILLSPSASSPKLSEAGSYIYRNYPSDELEAVNTANDIYNRVGIHEVAILGSQSEYGLGVKNAFIQRFRMLGGTVLVQETFTANATELSSQIEAVGATKPRVIYIAGYSAEIAAVAKAIRGAGIKAQLYGTGAIQPLYLVKEGGDEVEGLVFPSPVFDPDSDKEAVRRFISGYRQKFGESFDVYAAHGYDAVNILVQAIEQMGIRSADISFYLNTMNPFEGAAGTTTFDDKGDVRKFHRMLMIQGRKAVPVPPASSRPSSSTAEASD